MSANIKRIYLRLTFIVLTAIALIILMHYSIYYGVVTKLLLEYRYARVYSVVLSGLILGITGSYLQGCLRNPLVDHYILGIGSGALFAVYLSILLKGYDIALAPLSAIIGGLSALALTILIAEAIGGSDTAYVLAGLGVNSLFSGASILLTYIISAKYPFAIHLLIGSFVTATPKYYPLLSSALIILLVSYPFLAKPLNTLVLGDQYAMQLGYNPIIYRRIAIVLAGISASIIVSLYGLIGFIGLVSPHIARFLLKSMDHRFTIPLSGLTASILLLITDDFARIFLSEVVGEVPAGAIVSVFGAPFFLFLIVSRFKRSLR